MIGIAGAGLALSAVGTVTSATAQKQQGVAANAAADRQAAAAQYKAEAEARSAEYKAYNAKGIYEYKAGISDFTASLGEVKAQRIEQEAQAQSEIIIRSTARGMGRAAASYAAAGVTGEGSPLMVLNDLATEGQLQSDLTLYGGRVAATDARNQAKLDTSQAAIYRALATQEEGNARIAASTYRTAGNMAADSLRAGGAAAAGAAELGADATLLTGLGKAASGIFNLATSNGPGGGSGGGAPGVASSAGGAGAVPVSY